MNKKNLFCRCAIRCAMAAAMISTAIAAGPTTAFALIEVKGGYSYLEASPSDLNQVFTDGNDRPGIETLEILNADVMASLPAMPVGLGVRYETIKSADSNSSGGIETDWKRVSVLINKRIVDTGFYFGPIATVSVSNDFKVTTTDANGNKAEYKADRNFSASAGFEAGAKFMLVQLGGEVGYLHAPLGDLRNTATGVSVQTDEGSLAETDMSGLYIRGTVGFGF